MVAGSGLGQSRLGSAPTIPVKDDTSIASESSGFGSLTKKKSPDHQSLISTELSDPMTTHSSDATLDALSSEPIPTFHQPAGGNQVGGNHSSNIAELGHSRNSSNTSQV